MASSPARAGKAKPPPDLGLYQRAKTGSLFAGAAMAGAAAAGHAAEPWAMLGYRLGEAYQVADDIRDVMCSAADIGKPVGQDEALGRPNAVQEFGVRGRGAQAARRSSRRRPNRCRTASAPPP